MPKPTIGPLTVATRAFGESFSSASLDERLMTANGLPIQDEVGAAGGFDCEMPITLDHELRGGFAVRTSGILCRGLGQEIGYSRARHRLQGLREGTEGALSRQGAKPGTALGAEEFTGLRESRCDARGVRHRGVLISVLGSDPVRAQSIFVDDVNVASARSRTGPARFRLPRDNRV